MVIALFIPSLLMLFYVGYLLRSAWYFVGLNAKDETSDLQPSVTVIVPARNEAQNIAACISAILSQNYPPEKVELIVVDDHSEDATAEIAKAASSKTPNFKLLELKTHTGVAYKKAAVAYGISQAKGEIILATDADCQMGSDWLKSMIACFAPKTGMVSGPVMLESERIFGQMQALEFMGLIAVGAAGIAAGDPTMCNGANLAYRKSVFEEVGGFEGIDHIASGDDELLMHKIAAETKWDVRFSKNKASIVRTGAQETWEAFKKQRIRWVSKSTQYKRKRITWTLILSYLAMLGFPILIAIGFFEPLAWWIALGNLSLKFLGEFAVLYPAAKFFGKLPLLKWLLPEQLGHILYVLWVGLAGNKKSYEWKGRKVK